MIDKNELRIGNFVSYFESYVRVTEIKTYGNPSVYYISGIGLNGYTGFGNVIDAFNPIPLTHEMFVDSFQFAESFTLRVDNGGAVGIEQYSEGEDKLWHIKHLHQLQNLYFALTGEELMIDEQKLKRSVATTAK